MKDSKDAENMLPEEPKKSAPGGKRDHPEQYPTDNPSLFDMWESERNVDPIPMEDLNLETKEEQRRNGDSKHESSSEEKYGP